MNDVKVMVTGAAGFIGSHLTTRLVEHRCEVVAIDNLSTGSAENLNHVADRIQFVFGDVNDQSLLDNLLEGVDVVFHQAALASVPRSIELPLESHLACATATVTLLEACRRTGVRRVVYAGSSSAYGNNDNPRISESELPAVLSPYAAAKLSGELYCQAFAECYDLEVVRLRYFNVFGPRQDPNSPYSAVIPIFADTLLQGQRPTIFGDGTQTRDFTYVDNVVQANLLAANTPGISGRVYNVATGTSVSVWTLLSKICQILDVSCDPVFAEVRPGDVPHSGADISSIKRDLGFSEQVSFETGLKNTTDFYREVSGTSKTSSELKAFGRHRNELERELKISNEFNIRQIDSA